VAAGCHTRSGFLFQPKLLVAFDGGETTSDAGLLLLREFDERLGLTRALKGVFHDTRDRRYITHDLLTLLRQRLYQIAAGYEDANDADSLRHDPTLQSVAHRPGKLLASQPTLSRFENSADWNSIDRLGKVSLSWFCRHAPWQRRSRRELVLDVDSTDDPTHGQQVLSFFNGHYDEHMYHPLLIFEAQTGHLLAARLRPGNESGATRLLPLLTPVVRRLRHTFPRRPLAVRADGAFMNPDLIDFLEAERIAYAIGLPRNSVLEARVATAREKARCDFERTRKPVRRFLRFWYQTRTWPHARLVHAKIEHSALGANIRFVVSNRAGTSEEVFTWYNQRGQAENFIKELKLDVAADRLSCHAYRANALRLQLHALAYNLLTLFRRVVLCGTALANATLGTMRLKLLKVGARVQRSVRRLWYHLPTGWPGQAVYLAAVDRLLAIHDST
jgi:hypothetical protein